MTLYVRDETRLAEEIRDAARVYQGSLGDPNRIRDASRGADVVVHTAAASHPQASIEALRWVNVAGPENVVRAAAAAGVRRVVHVSCADVTLANVDRVHWDESRSLGAAPLGEHARTKQLGEELVLAESGSEIEVVAVRPSLVWGPGDRSTLPRLLYEALHSGGLRLIGRGENLVSVIYIDHLVDAILACADKGTGGRGYYVTDNEFLEATEFYGELSTAAGIPRPRTGYPLAVEYALAWMRERTSGGGLTRTDVVHRGRPTFFNIQDAISELGFEPRIPLDEGMRRLSEWIRSEGGAETLAGQQRPVPDGASVADMVQAANEWDRTQK